MKYQTPDFEKLKGMIAQNREKFDAFFSLLLFYNRKFNLTTVTDPDEAEGKHFLDSVAGEAFFPQNAYAAEVGSGAGFPSVPLMLVRPDLRFTLIESTGKKCAFLREVIKELDLSAEVACMRAEDAGKDPAYREKYDLCCARAVAPLPSLAEYCMPLVRKGGLFLAYKGAEPEQAWRALAILGGGSPQKISYELPSGFGARTLIAVEKIKPTPFTYPRGNGAERNRPL